MLIKDQDGNYIIKPRQPGYETVPLAGAVAWDLNADTNSVGFDAPAEFAAGGATITAAYAGVMRGLELIPLYRAGQISRQALVKECLSASWECTKSKAAYIIVAALIVSLLPGTGIIFAAASVVGMSVCSVRLVRAFIDALDDTQVSALRKAAAEAGVTIQGLPVDEAPAKPSAAGYSETDPLPSFG
ncbi:hypothetical protein [Synechococcus sp. SYN20]|uniref:hypothetical protein n=1 Tax=Synechococcus sp. SYN20 TaxID=1050714 RepID=UPI0016493CBA|nr:hypothetical protein [Synechococcus sp. SYN20]